MNLWDIAVKRPIATLMVFVAILLLGAVAFIGIKVDLLPQFEPDVYKRQVLLFLSPKCQK